MFGTESSEFLWFVVGLVFMFVELGVSRFVSVFFAIGAWITAMCTAAGLADSLAAQVLVFLACSVSTLLAFRKLMISYFTTSK